MNNTLYLFRHGLATTSTQGYGDQIKSAGLLPEGVQQARRIGEFLKGIHSDTFYSSTYPRCTQTSDIISTITDITYQTDKRLNEYNEISFEDFVTNLRSFLHEISQKEAQNILICTHAADIIALKKLIFNEDLNVEDILSNDPPTGVLQIIHKTSLKEMDFNTTV